MKLPLTIRGSDLARMGLAQVVEKGVHGWAAGDGRTIMPEKPVQANSRSVMSIAGNGMSKISHPWMLLLNLPAQKFENL